MYNNFFLSDIYYSRFAKFLYSYILNKIDTDWKCANFKLEWNFNSRVCVCCAYIAWSFREWKKCRDYVGLRTDCWAASEKDQEQRKTRRWTTRGPHKHESQNHVSSLAPFIYTIYFVYINTFYIINNKYSKFINFMRIAQLSK